MIGVVINEVWCKCGVFLSYFCGMVSMMSVTVVVIVEVTKVVVMMMMAVMVIECFPPESSYGSSESLRCDHQSIGVCAVIITLMSRYY